MIIDPARADELPVADLPDGGPRLAQSATGIEATLVNGQLVTSAGQHTGATPGVFLRGGESPGTPSTA